MSNYEIVIKDVEPLHALTLREIAPEPSHVGAMIGDGFAALMPAGIMPTAPCFSLYHDPEFKPDHIDVEIAFPVPQQVTEAPQTPAGRGFGHRIVPGGKMAVTVHQGAYDTINQAYAAIGEWLEANDLTIAGPPQEAYLTAPDDPAGPITEIRWPVA